jgi:hypothetical protein
MHVLREFLSLLANNYSAYSPIWRVSIAVVGILLCLIGGQAIFEQLVSQPTHPGPGPAREDFSGREILIGGQYVLSLLSVGAAVGIILRRERRTGLEPAIPDQRFGKRRSVPQPAIGAAHAH